MKESIEQLYQTLSKNHQHTDINKSAIKEKFEFLCVKSLQVKFYIDIVFTSA